MTTQIKAFNENSQIGGRTVDESLSKLNPRQRRFVLGYIDPKSPTYGNQRQSYLAAYGGKQTDMSASVSAHDLLKRPKVRIAMDTIFEAQGLTLQDRAFRLAEIAEGRARRVTKQYVIKDGERVQASETEAEPTFSDSVKAIDVANRMTGEYERRRAERDVAVDEYRALCASVFRKKDNGR